MIKLGIISLSLFAFGIIALFLYVQGVPEILKPLTDKLPGQEFDLSKKKEGFDTSKIRQGCPFRDCIPAIDDPKFITAAEAESRGEITDESVVFAVFHDGVARAYPQSILNWHEIINDKIGDSAFSVTFCPLCGTSIGFERIIEIDGVKTETTLGVSGKLLNSNLIMYDRVSDTLWQQLGGEAIVGDLIGQKLKSFRVDTVIWKDWKKLHPDTEVLSQDTGHYRNYNSYPYGDYEENKTYLFAPEITDDRLHPKEIVWGIVINDEAKAYSDEALEKVGTLSDTVGGEKIKITRSLEGQVRITNSKGADIIPDRSMWFAWFAFNKETKLYM